MARIDNTDKKKIVDFFQRVGYEVTFLNASDESVSEELVEGYSSSWNKPRWYTSPITIVGNQKGDVWNIYTHRRTSFYSLDRYFKVNENGVIEYVGADNDFRLEKVSSGSKVLDNIIQVDLDSEEYQSINEFANFENFDSINAPNYSVLYADDPQLSVASPITNLDELTESQIEKAEKKIEESKNALAQLIEADEKGDIANAMWTFDEIDDLYNAKITSDDKRAFFIYLQNKNKKKLTGDFDKKYGSSYPAQATDILELMKKGALFYDPTAKLGERLQPKVIYKSGNLWKKYASITGNKEEYIKRFGEEIYQMHLSIIKPAFDELNDKRLKVIGDKSMRLTLLPISSMANDIKINAIVNPADRSIIERNFKTYTSFIKGELIEDYVRTQGDAKNFIDKKTISLYQGFIQWCKLAGSGQQAVTNGVQWSNITTSIDELLDYYLKPKTNPFKKEAGGEDKWERYKDDARKVGERLFSQFLSEGIEPEDQQKVEYIWNSAFNNYVEPVLEEVPIGFTFKKYFLNVSLFLLRESNLRAIRYYLTRGSVGLAYGVGLGKTYCSIFTMKQALDLGLAKRPLVIVPNQVYAQFSNEIQSGLGKDFDPTAENSRLNMFYNGYGEVNSTLGNNAVDGINICTYEATEAFQFDKRKINMSWVEKSVSIIESGGELQQIPILENFVQKHQNGLFNEESISDDTDESDEDILEEDVIDDTLITSDEEEDDIFGGEEFAEGGGVKKSKKVTPIIFNSPFTNYDMLVVDEAHNFNSLFQGIVGEPKAIQKAEKNDKGVITIQREKHPYSSIRETNKKASARAEKLWFLARFIQYYNPMGNTILLSATPFTNSPLQLYSMLSLLNYEILEQSDLGLIKDFFDTFSKIEYAEDFKTDLTITKRNKFVGWTNVMALQKYVYRVFDKSSREEEDKAVVRPNKWTLPLKRQMIDGKVVEFAKENYVSTTIRMSDLQLELWQKVRMYAQGDLRYEELFGEADRNTTYLGKYTAKKSKKSANQSDDDKGAEIEIEDADNLADGSEEGEKSKDTAKALKCLMWGRQIALNPYLFKGSGFKKNPTGRQYVEQSPKLLYVMECIRSIKKYYDDNPSLGFWDKTDPSNPTWVNGMSGQVIYMNFGTKAFELIRDYLVEELGFNINEIGIIRGDGNYIGKKRYDSKRYVQDAFQGQILNAETGKFKPIPSEKRVKVLIGSEAIKEGINLQNYASVLYNCFLDFNPTDQVQLEGRIWRQGNALANVRIVTPLMSDCIDIFMFQKLEDKTERINQIWTKNGNLNELDTTAFNPAELKYELLTDPKQIARLERQNKNDKLEEKKVTEGEILSGYLSLESIFKSAMEIKYKSFETFFYVGLYYKICQIRPDLIDKELFNNDFYLKTLAPIFFEQLKDEYKIKMGIFSVQELIRLYPTIGALERDNMWLGLPKNEYNLWRQQYENPLWRMNLEKSLNYSAEDLINLMVQVLKEQKIAYPRGYSKNWRELIPKQERPIVDGDEVEFDTKKGRKKGIAEVVTNADGTEVLSAFFYHLAYQFRNNDGDKNAINEAIQRLKLSALFDDYLGKNSNYDNLDDKQKSELSTLLKDFYETNPNSIMTNSDGEYSRSLKPVSLDVGEIEDIDIVDKNVVRVKKEGEGGKKVEPTKYPEPFVWSNKDRDDNLIDIAKYYAIMVFDKKPPAIAEFISLPVEEQKPIFTSYFQSIIPTFFPSYGSENKQYLETFSNRVEYLPKTWAELVDSWKDSNYNGLFKLYSEEIYSANLPITLAEFKRAEEKKLNPMGINNYQDIQNLILGQKEKINTISLEQRELFDEQMFEEQIQEVIREQQRLNSEEIRKGTSFKARAISFATPNSDYLGNELLSIFKSNEKNQTQEVQQKVDAIIEAKLEEPIVEEPIEVEETIVQTKSTQEIIDGLEELIEFEEPEDRLITRRIIEDLREAMMFE
jgi:hypothetical protein